MWETFETIVNSLRNDLLVLENKARELTEDMNWSENREGQDIVEATAQSILAMRHLEDARMRYGKVLQYLWDWTSIYDK
jgi:hypothetical protein